MSKVRRKIEAVEKVKIALEVLREQWTVEARDPAAGASPGGLTPGRRHWQLSNQEMAPSGPVHLMDNEAAKRKWPSLGALRAFESAARFRNFSKAAQELNVTTSAVSHQIRSLEAWLGTQLFVRNARPLRLTDAGTVYFYSITRAFDQVSIATRQILDGSVRTTLTVSTMDSFAISWLVPRLARFRKMHDWLDVRISTGDRFVDFEREDIDLAIRYGSGQWLGTTSELLFEDRIVPVCSPRLLHGEKAGAPFEIEKYVLVHDGAKPGWTDWFAANGSAAILGQARGIYFNHTYLALQAAMSGDGIALASEPLVHDALADGRLVQPVPSILRGFGAYYFVTWQEGFSQEKIRIFCDWLFDERNAAVNHKK